MSGKLFDRLAAAGVFVASLVVYTLTMARTSPFWDSGEFIAISNGLQVSHPPGAPFYMLVGRLFAMFSPLFAPFTDEPVAMAVNFVSPVVSALTILLTAPHHRAAGARLDGPPDRVVVDGPRGGDGRRRRGGAGVRLHGLVLVQRRRGRGLRDVDALHGPRGVARARLARRDAPRGGRLPRPRRAPLRARRQTATSSPSRTSSGSRSASTCSTSSRCSSSRSSSSTRRSTGPSGRPGARLWAVVLTGLGSAGLFFVIYPGVVQTLPTLAGDSGAPGLFLLAVLAALVAAVWWTQKKRMPVAQPALADGPR